MAEDKESKKCVRVRVDVFVRCVCWPMCVRVRVGVLVGCVCWPMCVRVRVGVFVRCVYWPMCVPVWPVVRLDLSIIVFVEPQTNR